jgi:hypothetical protein
LVACILGQATNLACRIGVMKKCESILFYMVMEMRVLKGESGLPVRKSKMCTSLAYFNGPSSGDVA